MSNLAQRHLAKSIVSTTESLLKYDQDETLVTSSPQHIHDSLGRSVMISISDNWSNARHEREKKRRQRSRV